MRRGGIWYLVALFFPLVSSAISLPLPGETLEEQALRTYEQGEKFEKLLTETLPEFFVLAKEAIIGAKQIQDFVVDPTAPMPVSFPKDGELPPKGWAYAVVCMEGAGLGTVFFQSDSTGAGSHAWFEAYYSDGTKEAASHNKGGSSGRDLEKKGPKIAKIAYLLPEETVKNCHYNS